MLGKMKKKLMFAATALALGVIFANGGVATPSANAEQPITRITVTPTKLSVDLMPGQEKSGEYTVINSGNQTINLKVYPSPYKIDDQNGKYEALYETEWSRALLAKWISYEETEFSLKPDEEKVVKFRVAVPADVPAGGQYAMLMTEIQPSKAAEENATILTKKRIGLNLLGHVTGQTRFAGDITNLGANFWQNTTPLTAIATAKNSGNIDFAVNSEMIVRDLFGKEVYKTDVTSSDVYPDTKREISQKWDGAKWGIYRVEIKADMIFAGKKQNHSATKIVIVFPIWLAILLAIIIVGLIVLFFAKKKKTGSLKIAKKKGKIRS